MPNNEFLQSLLPRPQIQVPGVSLVALTEILPSKGGYVHCPSVASRTGTVSICAINKMGGRSLFLPGHVKRCPWVLMYSCEMGALNSFGYSDSKNLENL